MTIDEAIKNSRESAFHLEREGMEDWAKGVELGIEALKAVAKMRHYPFPSEILQLPGETE